MDLFFVLIYVQLDQTFEKIMHISLNHMDKYEFLLYDSLFLIIMKNELIIMNLLMIIDEFKFI